MDINIHSTHGRLNTALFIKTVPSMHTLLMDTIYISLSTQVAEGTVFRNSRLVQGDLKTNKIHIEKF